MKSSKPQKLGNKARLMALTGARAGLRNRNPAPLRSGFAEGPDLFGTEPGADDHELNAKPSTSRHLLFSIGRRPMSVQELKALARKHWAQWLPEKVRELKAEGKLNEALQEAANLAQAEIEHLMKQGNEAREVALPQFILLKPEAVEPDEQDEELAEKEREYQKNPAVFLE
jgi:hypothetical protein